MRPTDIRGAGIPEADTAEVGITGVVVILVIGVATIVGITGVIVGIVVVITEGTAIPARITLTITARIITLGIITLRTVLTIIRGIITPDTTILGIIITHTEYSPY